MTGTTHTQMSTKIPSSDIYTYEKQALDSLPKDHPHYEEIKDLHRSAQDTYGTLSDKGKQKAHKKMGRTLGSGKDWIEKHGEGPK